MIYITQHRTDVLFINWERDEQERQDLMKELGEKKFKSDILCQFYLMNRSIFDNVSSRSEGQN